MSNQNLAMQELTLSFLDARTRFVPSHPSSLPDEESDDFRELVRRGTLVIEAAKEASFREIRQSFMALVRPGKGLNKVERELLEAAIPKASTLSELESLAEVNEDAKRNFRHLFLEQAVKLSNGKDELVSWLRKLGYLND